MRAGNRAREFTACLLVLAAALKSCSRTEAPPLGVYRVVVSTEGGDLPFGLELAREDGKPVAYLINGPERARSSDVQLEGNQLSVKIAGYQNRIEATYQDGRFEGTLFILRPRGVVKEFRLVAMPDEGWRFFPKPVAEPMDFSGRWALTYRDDDGKESMAIAELKQEGYVVTGTVLRTSGDDRYIAGEARGDTLFLSRFDGGSAYLYLARLRNDGVLSGDQYTAGGSHDTFTGRRDPNAKLDAKANPTALKPGVDHLVFSFPDIEGKLHDFPDERYDGKVVLITIGGSWCPNCHDEAAFLKELLASRQARGLEVIQLMFERTEDFASSAKAAGDFAKEFAIPYPVLIAGSVTDGNVLEKLPQLEGFHGYPSMFVIDRKGVVRAVHTGFSGPATGEHYEEQNRELTALVDKLLDESA
jgi:peroxiredoxin